jgi:hypothetical protein
MIESAKLIKQGAEAVKYYYRIFEYLSIFLNLF